MDIGRGSKDNEMRNPFTASISVATPERQNAQRSPCRDVLGNRFERKAMIAIDFC
jgi:hypothetical protein